MMSKKAAFIVLAGLFLLSSAGAAVMPALTEMSLEELMNVEITSVSKTPQVLAKTPAAVYVINNEEIHRSGQTTIPDLLRTVPGVQVARIDSNNWGVSIRGFNDRFNNKLLVLMDGRSVYTPLFSGTFWNIQDTEFEDIDRIEVIRGPGGTVWGANAVNGVINIITKSAKETQGGYAAGGYGTKENGFGDLRYGGKVGDNFYYRFYDKYYNRGKSVDGQDDWEAGKFGGRADWDIDSQNNLTIQGDYYGLYGYMGDTIRRFFPPSPFGTPGFGGPYDQVVDANTKTRGRNVLTRFTHTFDKDSDLSVQAYYDFTYLGNPFLGEARDTSDIDARYRFPLHIVVPQEIIAGVGYRYTSDTTSPSYEVSFNPASKSLQTVSWSIQDELRLVDNFMTLWVGSKFEHNDYTGFEYQPSVRLAVYPDSKNTVWGSITRAVRTPARADEDVLIHFVQGLAATGGPLEATYIGNKNFKSEELVSYEAGVKSQVTESLNADLAFFYNEYNRLRTSPLGDVTVEAFPSLIARLPLMLTNRMRGETYGAEVSLKYYLTKRVRLFGNYSYLHIRLHPDPTLAYNPAAPGDAGEGESPNHQASTGVSIDLPWNVYFDTQLRYVGALNAVDEQIPEYLAADMRLAWKPREDLELSVVGLNLFDAYHYEFKTPNQLDFLGQSRRAQPSVYGKVEAKF